MPKLIDSDVPGPNNTTLTWKRFRVEAFNPLEPSGALEEIRPLESLLVSLEDLSGKLNPSEEDPPPTLTEFPLKLDNVDKSVANVSDTLVNTGKALGQIANALHASPSPPSELLS